MNKIIGMGNALVDVLTILKSDRTLKEFDLPKGSMQLVSKEFSNRLLAGTLGLQRQQSSGGSAANTIHGLAHLGMETGFVGKIGKDNLGKFFVKDLKDNNITPVMFHGLEETGRSIALVSKDTERTMATYLGAAGDLHQEDIDSDIFKGYRYFHLEGYLVQNRSLIKKAVRVAKAHDLIISLDMATYNIVSENREFLVRLIREYVDILMANESEAEALTRKKANKALDAMADIAAVAVLKMGKDGSMAKRGKEKCKIGIEKVNSIDTTGAGDLYAAGFLYGYCHGQSLEVCGRIGSILGGHITEVIGAKMDKQKWTMVKEKVSEVFQA
ncbi:MAG: sugar kinase [Bacteroides sp. SM1_62]|nr:MAG: sugar kinase [Bacteroides sp. SM1_62]